MAYIASSWMFVFCSVNSGDKTNANIRGLQNIVIYGRTCLPLQLYIDVECLVLDLNCFNIQIKQNILPDRPVGWQFHGFGIARIQIQ